MANQALKLLIADRESLVARRIKEFLSENGVECEIVNSGKQLKEMVQKIMPDFILIDLLLPDCPPLELLAEIKNNPVLRSKDIKVMVTSSHNSAKNVKQVYAAGACDYIVKPFKVDEILARIVFQLQKRPASADGAGPGVIDNSAPYLNLMELVLREATSSRHPREKLFFLMQMLAMSMKAVRCSVIRTQIEESEGTVVASSDDIKVKKIKLDLTKYPEVIHTVNTMKTTTIENLDFNPELARLKKIVKTISFNSIVVAPIFLRGDVFGVVSARMDSKTKKFSDMQIRFCQLVAGVCSMIINSTEYYPFIDVAFEEKVPETSNAA